jgi:hypothetical protein
MPRVTQNQCKVKDCTGTSEVLETRRRPDDTTYRRYCCTRGHRWSSIEHFENVKGNDIRTIQAARLHELEQAERQLRRILKFIETSHKTHS